MKIKLLTIASVLSLLTGTCFSQNVVIDYQAWNPSSSQCNVFGGGVNVPATVDGSSSTIQHQTLIGQPKYNSSSQAVHLDVKYVSSSSSLGARYRISYNFKVGYKYIITISASAAVNTAGTPYGPYLRTDLTNNGGGTGNTCNGPESIDVNLGGNPSPLQLSSLTYGNLQFAYSTALTTAYSSLELSAMPTNPPDNTIRIQKVTINETPPPIAFSLSPSSVSKICGTGLSQTFTANATYIPPGATVSYLWNLGSPSNGWLLNGSPAPQTVTTTVNTLTLSNAACDNAPSNIAVTVTVNSTNYNAGTISETVGLPSYSINGPSVICSTTPGSYSITNLTCGNATVTWSASPSGIVSIASPNSQQTTISYTSNGIVTLTASINSCGQLNIQTMQLRAGGYSSGDYPVSGPSSTSCNSYITYYCPSLPGATNYSWFYPGTWNYVSGQGTNMLTLQATGASGYYQIGVRVANNCDAGGSPAIQTTYFSGCGFAPVYTVYPNPATSTITTTSKTATVKSINRPTPSITQINIYDVQGVLKKHVLFNKVKTAKVDVSGLITGSYYIEIFDGIHKETQQLQILKP